MALSVGFLGHECCCTAACLHLGQALPSVRNRDGSPSVLSPDDCEVHCRGEAGSSSVSSEISRTMQAMMGARGETACAGPDYPLMSHTGFQTSPTIGGSSLEGRHNPNSSGYCFVSQHRRS